MLLLDQQKVDHPHILQTPQTQHVSQSEFILFLSNLLY